MCDGSDTDSHYTVIQWEKRGWKSGGGGYGKEVEKGSFPQPRNIIIDYHVLTTQNEISILGGIFLHKRLLTILLTYYI